MIKFSEIKNDELIIVISKDNGISEEVVNALSIRRDKKNYVGKEMYIAKEYKPKLEASEVINWIEEYIQCNDEEICEEWEIQCSQKDESEMQGVIDKILGGSSLSWTYGDEIQNDL